MNKISNKASGLTEKLLLEIANGVHRPALRLPSERAMCERYGVSRTTVRRALRELVADGVLQTETKRGLFVAPGALDRISSAHPAPSLQAVFHFHPMQLGNPLLQRFFQSCKDASESSIQCTAHFEEELTLPALLMWHPDVVVLFSHPGEIFLRQLARKVRAVYLINCIDPAFSYLAPDNYKGGRLMAQCLLENGHRQIGCIRARGGNQHSEFAQRIQGCCEFLEDACVHPELAFISGEDLFQTMPFCADALDALLRKNPALSALFVPTDIMALGVYSGLYRRNLAIGQDISVIAFDDQFYARHIRPRLTTVKYPAEAMGMRLAESLQQVLRNGEAPIQQMIAPVLIKRESVADLRTHSGISYNL